MKNNWSLIIDHWKLKKGFSLIELVIAMSFLTIIVFGVVNLYTSNLAMITRQNNQIQAHFYANQGLQIARAIGYANIDCQNVCYLNFNSTNKTYSLKKNGEEIIDNTFKRYLEINQPSTLSKAYKVTSIIEWEDATGKHTKADGGHIEAKLIISK